MKGRSIQLLLVMAERSDSESETDTGDSVEDVMSELKQQMAQIDTVSKALDVHVADLYRRARTDTVDWMHEPLKPRRHIESWCSIHSLPSRPTLDEFVDACLTAARTVDLETRVITFHKEEAAILWDGQRRLTIFDLIARIPTLFE